MITVLRNPYDRLLSLYHYWRSVPETFGAIIFAKTLSFEDFVDRAHYEPELARHVTNGQTFQIASGVSLDSRAALNGMSDEDILARAISHLDEYACVGVTEALDLFFEDLSATFGLKIEPHRVNVTENRPPASATTLQMREKIYPLVKLDLALYDYTLRQFVFGRSVSRSVGRSPTLAEGDAH